MIGIRFIGTAVGLVGLSAVLSVGTASAQTGGADSEAAPKSGPFVRTEVTGAAHPGDSVTVDYYCDAEPSTLGASQGFAVSGRTHRGFGRVVGTVAKDARAGRYEVVLVCGPKSFKDSFQVRH
jgi:hypothetical protein